MENKKFIYDEKTSSLYSPEGHFIKKIFCPKAKTWNQLISFPGDDRKRGCSVCQKNVYNLELNDLSIIEEKVSEAEEFFEDICLYIPYDSNSLIVLKDPDAVDERDLYNSLSHRIFIRTVRNIQDIQRALQMGFWPDVRPVVYDTEKISSKLAVTQNTKTGEVRMHTAYDCRVGVLCESNDDFIIEPTSYYQYQQQSPIAAYLIPNDVLDGQLIYITDPIEDIVGSTYQCHSEKIDYVEGEVRNKKIILDLDSAMRYKPFDLLG